MTEERLSAGIPQERTAKEKVKFEDDWTLSLPLRYRDAHHPGPRPPYLSLDLVLGPEHDDLLPIQRTVILILHRILSLFVTECEDAANKCDQD
jgi:hypothetical protein